MQVKKKPNDDMIQKHNFKSLFKWTKAILWSDKLKFFLENMDTACSGLKSKGTVIGSELSNSDGMWVHYGLWKSQLHIWKATMPKDIHWF